MQKVLITGGSGTVGSAFIARYRTQYDFAIVSRNEKNQYDIKNRFPATKLFLAAVENREDLFRVYDAYRPDIVIHAAAMKHVDMAERQPIQTVKINICGSINIIDASTEFNVPITAAISTDKACEHQNVYGISKYLMEQCFLEADGIRNRFAVCRFGNVAYSNGSVLPFWKKLAAEGKPLKVTDPKMNRLMFSQEEAADLINQTIGLMRIDGGFILSKKMKNVNMMDLAKAISSQVEIVGARPGEKLDENLISEKEVPYTKVISNGYVKITKEQNMDLMTRLVHPYNTKTAEAMTEDEIQALIRSQ